jgi:hypothetical protein
VPVALKRARQSILVIDKNVEALIEIADRHYLIERGSDVERNLGRAYGCAGGPASLPRHLRPPRLKLHA